MRILDRQRYWAFLKAYLICFVALIGLYVVIDAFENLNEFTKVTEGTGELLRHMGWYYLVRMSAFYDRLSGVITMMAAIFTVTWMQKNNELLAMLAAGISTHRVIRPVLIAALVVSGLSVANQEFILSHLGEELQKRPDDDGTVKMKVYSQIDTNGVVVQGRDGLRAARTVVPFGATLPDTLMGSLVDLEGQQARYIPADDRRSPLRGGWLIRAARLTPAKAPTGTLAKPSGHLLIRLTPAEARRFPLPADLNDEELRKAEPRRAPGSAGRAEEIYFLRSDATFQAITRDRHWYQFASTPDLLRALGDPTSKTLQTEIAVFLHARNLRPLLGLALLGVSLPMVLGGVGRNMFINLGLSLGTSAVFYVATFILQYLGNNRILPATLAAWLPLIAFGTLAVSRWDRIRT